MLDVKRGEVVITGNQLLQMASTCHAERSELSLWLYKILYFAQEDSNSLVGQDRLGY